MPSLKHSPREEVTREREDLLELVKSDGWRRFVLRATTEWKGDGLFARLGSAVQSADPLEAKVLYRVALEIERLVNYPENRLAELKGEAE